jgi:signal transduction histidine kinase
VAATGSGRASGQAIIVTDSLGLPASARVADAAGQRQDAVAIQHLAVLGNLKIGAFIVDRDEVGRAHALQARLVGWGILLLVLMILGSAVALISGAHRQVMVARRRNEFMAGMSHDLRTPVAAMRVMAESLQAGRVSTEARRKEFLDAIVTECDRLGDLIERIMFYFRQEQGMLKYDKHVIDVSAIASTVVARFRRQHPGRVNITLQCDEDVKPVLADADAIEKALTNLIDNAVKYGQSHQIDNAGNTAGSIDISVKADARCEGRKDWTVLTVQDRGEGIASGEHRRIFGRFYRAYSGRHTHRGGFGLGLSMVADIVNAHKGRISVYNANEGGAVFEIWLRSVTRNHSKREDVS